MMNWPLKAQRALGNVLIHTTSSCTYQLELYLRSVLSSVETALKLHFHCLSLFIWKHLSWELSSDLMVQFPVWECNLEVDFFQLWFILYCRTDNQPGHCIIKNWWGRIVFIAGSVVIKDHQLLVWKSPCFFSIYLTLQNEPGLWMAGFLGVTSLVPKGKVWYILFPIAANHFTRISYCQSLCRSWLIISSRYGWFVDT